MAKSITSIRVAIGAIVMLCLVAIAAPVSAQDRNPDGSVNPTASSVKEDQLLKELRIIRGARHDPGHQVLQYRAASGTRVAAIQ